MFTFPSHRASKLENSVHALKQIAVPMLFQTSPTAFNRVVFAVIGRRISQRKRHACLGNKLHHTRQKLGAATVTLLPIVEIEEKRPHLGKPRFSVWTVFFWQALLHPFRRIAQAIEPLTYPFFADSQAGIKTVVTKLRVGLALSSDVGEQRRQTPNRLG